MEIIICPGGETGKRNSFKNYCILLLEGSSPSQGIKNFLNILKTLFLL